MLRKSLLAASAVALELSACSKNTPQESPAPASGSTPSCDVASLNLVTAGTLTVGTQAVFLASADSAYITGQVLTVDGGLSLGAVSA